MKIRTNFVSNSSSTSYIVSYKKSIPCSHCGRTDPDLKKLIESVEGSWRSDDTKLTAPNAKNIIERLTSFIDGTQDEIDNLKSLHKENDVLNRFNTTEVKNGKEIHRESLYLVKDRIKGLKHDIEVTQRVLDKLQESKDEVIAFDLSYHDEVIAEIFENMIKSGTAKVIEKEFHIPSRE